MNELERLKERRFQILYMEMTVDTQERLLEIDQQIAALDLSTNLTPEPGAICGNENCGKTYSEHRKVLWCHPDDEDNLDIFTPAAPVPVKEPSDSEFTGEEIGVLKYNPESGDLKIYPKGDVEPVGEQNTLVPNPSVPFKELANLEPAAKALKSQLDMGMAPKRLLVSAIEYYGPIALKYASLLAEVDSLKDQAAQFEDMKRHEPYKTIEQLTTVLKLQRIELDSLKGERDTDWRRVANGFQREVFLLQDEKDKLEVEGATLRKSVADLTREKEELKAVLKSVLEQFECAVDFKERYVKLEVGCQLQEDIEKLLNPKP